MRFPAVASNITLSLIMAPYLKQSATFRITIHTGRLVIMEVTQIHLGAQDIHKSLLEITSTQLAPVPPLAVVPLQEVQESGISQLGITQYLEIKI